MDDMNDGELIPHLFRTEYRKIVSVLCRRFGFDRIEAAEDITSETFLAAAQAWGAGGIPGNPSAWLYLTAKNKALNYLRRESLFNTKISTELKANSREAEEKEIDLTPENINDSQLQMMFAICHPALSPEVQIALSLRILCGFSIEEISDAFLSKRETINKRLFRGRERLREEKIRIELPGPSEIEQRLETVMKTIYLLFSEGYYSVSREKTVRKDLCLEAMRLCTLLAENESTNRPAVNALLSLMCFHASRFDARINPEGELVLYEDQDTGLWNSELIMRGGYYLHCATAGNKITRYHLEAAIAYWHTVKEDTPEKWDNILQLFNRLLQIEYSPIAALNRTYALSKVKGKREAIIEAEKLKLEDNQFYFTLLGELYTGIDNGQACKNFREALSLARTTTDKQVIQRKIDKLEIQ